MTGIIWSIGRLLGLSTTAGVRAWTTLFVVGLLSREGWGIQVPSRFEWLESIPALLIMLTLGIVEIAIDKIPAYDRLHARLALPERLVAGAIVGACAVGHGWPGTVVGAALGAGLAFLGFTTWRMWRPRSSPSSSAIPLLSLLEDLAAAAGAFLSAILPPVGYALFGWLGWLRLQLRSRHKAKYRHLREGSLTPAPVGDVRVAVDAAAVAHDGDAPRTARWIGVAPPEAGGAGHDARGDGED
jgi:uncharacterized membrane protein